MTAQENVLTDTADEDLLDVARCTAVTDDDEVMSFFLAEGYDGLARVPYLDYIAWAQLCRDAAAKVEEDLIALFLQFRGNIAARADLFEGIDILVHIDDIEERQLGVAVLGQIDGLGQGVA